MKLSLRYLLLLTLGLQGPSVSAGSAVIPVVDATSSPVVENYPTVIATPAGNRAGRVVQSANSNLAAAELLYQLELLQQEVQQLRGIVEQQSWQIKQMGAEQRDRYVDLDRRIVLLSQPGVATELSAGSSIPPAPQAGADGSRSVSGQAAYQAAFSLIQNKRYDEAIAALELFIKNYPGSTLTGNAYYWLGEVQLVKANFQGALEAFNTLLARYPAHRKLPDAKYKLGRVYRELGDTTRANKLLKEVVTQYAGSSAAKLAEAELRNNRL